MLTPGLAELFESLSIVGAATHPIKILWNKGMVIAWQSNPTNVLSPFVTRVGSQSEANKAINLAIVVLDEVEQFANDDIRAGNRSNGRHNCRLRFPVNDLVDLDRLHRRTDRNFSNGRPRV